MMNENKRHMGTAATIGCDAENCAYNEQGRSCTAATSRLTASAPSAPARPAAPPSSRRAAAEPPGRPLDRPGYISAEKFLHDPLLPLRGHAHVEAHRPPGEICQRGGRARACGALKAAYELRAGASVSTPRARRTLSQNLYGLAVETTTAGVPSPLRARYSRRTREATAVCVSIR